MKQNFVRVWGTAAIAALLLTGCQGGEGTPGYGTKKRSLTVDKGEDFTLTVPASATLGQNWYLTDPRPDAAVVTFRGGSKEGADSEPGVDGVTGGAQSFRFTARARGKAKIKLLYCPLSQCSSPDQTGSAVPVPRTPGATTSSRPTAGSNSGPVPSPSTSWSPFPTVTGSPGAYPEFHVWTVTVR